LLGLVLETVRSEAIALPVKSIGVFGDIRVETLDGEVPDGGFLELDIFNITTLNLLLVQIVNKIVLNLSNSMIGANK
jgi:hypothetical protein